MPTPAFCQPVEEPPGVSSTSSSWEGPEKAPGHPWGSLFLTAGPTWVLRARLHPTWSEFSLYSHTQGLPSSTAADT